MNADSSGTSRPELDEGMIPIKWDGSKWIKADEENASGLYRWYNYDEREWANAVLVSSEKREEYLNAEPGKEIIETDVLAYLVWIPRYRYKIFNVNFDVIQPQEIEIRFESKDKPKTISRTNGEWLTHPAFTFGNIELNGFWVGKFETTGNTTTPTVKPGNVSLRGLNVSTQFNTAKKFNNPTTYGITTTNDAHMMKPTEWGAVAYLSHSKYGRLDKIWINPSSNYVTGCAGTGAEVLTTPGCSYHYYTSNGQQASTTANVYGIYDMNGGAWDRLMGGMYTSASKRYVEAGHSGFSDEQLTVNSPNFIGVKYIDLYEYGMIDDQQLYKKKNAR